MILSPCTRAAWLPLIGLFLAVAGFAREVTLFDAASAPMPDYEQRVQGLQPGDTIVFGNGRSFVLDAPLGAGTTTRIWALRDEGGTSRTAIRIPLKSGVYRGQFTYQQFVNETGMGYTNLAFEGVPTVRMLDFKPNQYVVVDRLDIQMSAKEFLSRPGADLGAQDKLTRGFVDFVAKTAHLKEIGDFNLDQLVYDRSRGWLLADWTNHVRQAPARGSFAWENIFSAIAAKIDKEDHAFGQAWSRLYDQIERQVEQSRAQARPVAPALSTGRCMDRKLRSLLW